MKYLLCALLVTLQMSAVRAQERAEPLTTLFTLTCMQHFHDRDGLPETMRNLGASEIPEDNAGFFLNGSPGKAWIVIQPEGRFVVSFRDDGICASFAQKASAENVQLAFVEMASSAPEPLVSEKRVVEMPPREDMTTISYGWGRPKDESELLFTLTTSTSEEVTAQAMISMAVSQK